MSTTENTLPKCNAVRRRQNVLISGTIALLLLTAIAISGTLTLFASTGQARVSLLDQERGVLSVAPVIEKAAPAVVNISVATRVPGSDNPLYRDPYFRRFFGVPDQIPEREALSAGSGVIVDAAKGYVLTNHHVIENASRITVRLKDGRQFKAKRIGSDAATDIGLLQIDAKRLVSLPFDETRDQKVGDFVLAIGNPFGLGQTVTSGIISALSRSGISRDKYEDFIQTDAPINPGNSGGALINTRGELVGINTAIIAPGGGNVGIGFAVPVDMARAVMDQLIRHGEVRRGRMGVSIQDITADIAQALNLPAPRGALISQVEKSSPAAKAGLQPGDAVVELDGQPVRSSNDLRNRVGLMERGTTVQVGIIRDGKRLNIAVQIGEFAGSEIRGETAVQQLAGTRITEIPDSHPFKGEVDGVLAAEVAPNSPAWRLGLRQGDIIVAVNRRQVASVSEFEQIAKSANDVLALNVLRGDVELFIVVQ